MCRNYVLSYLWSQPKLPPFVVQGLVTLYSRITKLGWFDSEKEDFVFRNAISDVTKFLGGSAEQCMMGIQLLSQLTCEMNQVAYIGAHIHGPKPS
jgi:exportin-7